MSVTLSDTINRPKSEEVRTDSVTRPLLFQQGLFKCFRIMLRLGRSLISCIYRKEITPRRYVHLNSAKTMISKYHANVSKPIKN